MANNARNRSNASITLFSAPGCHLCDEARAMLRGVAGGELTILNVDIRTSLELEREFGLRIPVVRFANGTELNWPFSTAQIERALRGVPG